MPIVAAPYLKPILRNCLFVCLIVCRGIWGLHVPLDIGPTKNVKGFVHLRFRLQDGGG